MQIKFLVPFFFFVAFADTATSAAFNKPFYPLHEAAKNGDVEAVVKILENLKKRNNDINDLKRIINQQERITGSTPLHYAASKGHLECLQKLLASGANVHAKDSMGWTVLHEAARTGTVACLRELITHGAHSDIQASGIATGTPLHGAAICGNVECLKELIVLGAHIDTEEAQNSGNTPLHCAAIYGNLACLKELVSLGANVNAKTNLGHTPLDYAVNNGHVACQEYLQAEAERQSQNLGANESKDQQPLGFQSSTYFENDL